MEKYCDIGNYPGCMVFRTQVDTANVRRFYVHVKQVRDISVSDGW